MIEKIERVDADFVDKINQLIDAVNSIQKEREAERFEIQEWIGILEAVRKSVNRHEDIIRQIGEWGSSKGECLWCANLTEVNLAENGNFAKNAQDPYKWIGKLCWFSNGDGFDEVGYLTEIDPDMPEAKFRCNCHDYYEECKPVKPDDDIIYKGE